MEIVQFNNSEELNLSRHSEKDLKAYKMMEENFIGSNLNIFNKLEAFPRFTNKRSLSRFIAKYEIFKKIMEVNGIIVECGVFNGSGLFTWAQLSNIFEPTNYNRKIVGFDTFDGFPNVSEYDENIHKNYGKGDLRGESVVQLEKDIERYQLERHLSHIPNIELVQGDFMETSEKYLENNKHVIVSLLYLDFDLYAPTKKALEVFLPRMSGGGCGML